MPLSIALKENKNTLTYSGKDSLKDLDSIIPKFKRVMVFHGVTGYKASGADDYFRELQENVKESTDMFFFSYAGKALPLEDIETIYQETCQIHGADLIIAIGGGTVMDLAKVVSVAYSSNCQSVEEVIDNQELENHLDLLFIPTTAGTGSEGTSFAVVYKDKIKLSIDKKSLLPDYIVLDPQLLKSLPENVLHSTVLDALAQSIESIWAKGSTIVSREYAAEAIEMILANIVKGDANRLSQLQIGSHLAGRAINISRTTMAHSISYPISAHFGVPHGEAVFLSLTEVAKLNYEATEEQLQPGLTLKHMSDAFELIFEAAGVEDIQQLIEKLHEVTETFGVPTRLSDYSIGAGDFSLIVDDTLSNQRSQNNPRKLQREDVVKILQAVL